MKKYKKILERVAVIVVIILLLVASYCLLAFALWAANVVPE